MTLLPRTDSSALRPASPVCDELRTMLAVKEISHGSIAERLGRSRSYVSSCLHGRQEFKNDELVAIADMLGASPSWCSYPGHTLRRLQKLDPVPHSMIKVMLRLAGWQRTRNTGHFTVWEHPAKTIVIALPYEEHLLSPTVTWWVIDNLTGVKLASRFPHQKMWKVQVHREGTMWLVSVPYARAYFQTFTLTGIRDLATEFVAAIARKPINDIRVNITLVLPSDMSDLGDHQTNIVESRVLEERSTNDDAVFDNIRMVC